MSSRPSTIQDTITVGQLPKTLASPGAPGTAVTIQANPAQEYIAAGGYQWYANLTRSLPWAIDDITTDFGDDLYERMLHDPQVLSCLNVLKAGILEDGVNLTSAIENEGDDGYEQAAELTDWCNRILDDLVTPLDDVLWDMLNALAFGNKVAEQVYELDTTYTGKSQLVLQKLQVKPRRSTSFVVDSFLNVLGILGVTPGMFAPVQPGTFLYDPKNTPNLFPRDKFAVMTFRPKDGDPCGTSVLRSSFSPWNAKTQLIPEWLKYLTQFASPSLIGTTAEGAQVQPATDSDGFPIPGTTLTPEQYMVNALVTFRNGTALAFPYGSTVTPVMMSGDGAAFLKAFELLDHQIAKGILNQTLATEQGAHASRAQASVHQDVLGQLVLQAKHGVQRMLRRDVLRMMVKYNYGDDAMKLTPLVQLGETEQQDFGALATAISALNSSKYLDPSQYAGIDIMLGLPERDLATQPTPEMIQQAAAQQAAARQNPPPPPGQQPTQNGQSATANAEVRSGATQGDANG